MGVYTANMRYEVYGTRRGMFGSLRLPFVKCSIFSVSLQRAFFNNKPHFLEKWGRWGRRLALQQNINGPSHCCAKLTSFADWGFTAFWVLAVNEAVYKSTLRLGLKSCQKLREINIPWSSSYPSSHRVSRRTLQSGPSHPSWQWHFHSPRKLALQPPWPEQPRGQPSKVQWRPFQPATQRQVPFLHCPWRLHRASQSCSSHLWPLHPASQTQAVSSHLENRHGKYRVLEINRIFWKYHDFQVRFGWRLYL